MVIYGHPECLQIFLRAGESEMSEDGKVTKRGNRIARAALQITCILFIAGWMCSVERNTARTDSDCVYDENARISRSTSRKTARSSLHGSGCDRRFNSGKLTIGRRLDRLKYEHVLMSVSGNIFCLWCL